MTASAADTPLLQDAREAIEEATAVCGPSYGAEASADDLQAVQQEGDELAALIADGDVESQTHKALGTGSVAWQMMTFILLVDMFGLGTLTLPSSFARLGWVPALCIMFVCAMGTLYSGRLFTLLAEKVPRARVFDDYGGAAMGNLGRRLVYGTVYLTILANPIIFQLTSVESLQQIFYQRNVSSYVAGAIVAGIMLPLSQVQGLEDVAALSIIGTVGMITSIAVAVGKLYVMQPPAGAHTELVHKPNDINVSFVGAFSIVFTYGGQVNWVRYLTQMRVRRHFPRAVAVTTVVMSAGFLVMGAVGYLRLGTDFDHEKPITSIVPQDVLWTPIMNAGLFAHCILAYQVNLNVWTDLVLHLVGPALGRPEAWARKPSWLSWGVVSIAGIAIAFIVAATFPFFSTIAAIIAAVGDLAGAYALPAIFLLTLAGARLAAWERGLLRVIIPVALILSAIGTYCSVHTLVLEFLHKQ